MLSGATVKDASPWKSEEDFVPMSQSADEGVETTQEPVAVNQRV